MTAILEFPAPAAAGYRTFETRDRRRLCLRRVTRDDAASLSDLLLRLSWQTRRLRYLSPRHFSLDEAWREAERICRGCRDPQLAVVALDPHPGWDVAVAVAELVPDAREPATGHLAAVVRDDYQGQGLGTALARHLLALAQGGVLTTLRADYLAENDASRRLLNHLGLRYSTRYRHGEIEVRAPLPW